MTAATLAPAPPVAARAVPGLEARLAAAGAEMTVRLESAALALAVDAAEPETVVDLVDVVTAPAPSAVDLDPTPVAALLLRARTRILAGGWSRDAARTSGGGMCLTEAIRAEAHTHADEGEARILLRRALGGDSIPEANRRLRSTAQAAAVLAAAANTAAQQGI